MGFVKRDTSARPPAEEGGPRRSCTELLGELVHDDAAVRRWAARDLVACPGAALALVERLKNEPLASVREVILTTLIRQGDAAAVSGLVDCLRSEEAAPRNEAIDAMKQLPDEVAPLMEQLLADADADVRIFAVNVLESMRHPQVEGWLIDVLLSEPHVNVCAAAIDVLSEVATARSRPALEQVTTRFGDEPYIQFAADLALGRLRED